MISHCFILPFPVLSTSYLKISNVHQVQVSALYFCERPAELISSVKPERDVRIISSQLFPFNFFSFISPFYSIFLKKVLK